MRSLYNPPEKDTRLSNWGQIAIVVSVTLVSLLIRFLCFPFISRDYEIFLSPWFEEIKANGGFMAIGRPIGDYLPSYIYILAALSYLPFDSLFLIKAVSCIGDIIMSYYAMKIVLAKTGKSNYATLVCIITLLLPTVILNSGVWGQCDSIYTAALLACLYYMMNGKSRAGMIAFGIAFVFKLQTVFFAPFILLLLIKKKIRFTQLFYVPAIYGVAILPAAIAGRSIFDLLTIYFRLVGSYSSLSLNAPNLYAFINTENTLIFSILGILFFVLIVACAFWKLWKTEFELTSDIMLRFCVLCALAVPFLLPHMHERYFYLADALTVIYAVVYRKRWIAPVIVVASSILVYGMYLFNFSWMNAAYAAVPMGCALCLVLYDTIAAISSISRQNATSFGRSKLSA